MLDLAYIRAQADQHWNQAQFLSGLSVSVEWQHRTIAQLLDENENLRQRYDELVVRTGKHIDFSKSGSAELMSDQLTQLQDKLLECASEWNNEKARLVAELRLHRDKANGDYWAWQGDGEDHPESLTCPVLVSADQVRAWLGKIEALRRFKAWTHAYLDEHGVPKEFPDGPHTKEGCRIGDRMDWFAAEPQRLRVAIRDAGFSVMQTTSGRWSIHDTSENGQAEEARSFEVATRNAELEVEIAKLRVLNEGLADRVAKQSELLSKKAERK